MAIMTKTICPIHLYKGCVLRVKMNPVPPSNASTIAAGRPRCPSMNAMPYPTMSDPHVKNRGARTSEVEAARKIANHCSVLIAIPKQMTESVQAPAQMRTVAMSKGLTRNVRGNLTPTTSPRQFEDIVDRHNVCASTSASSHTPDFSGSRVDVAEAY